MPFSTFSVIYERTESDSGQRQIETASCLFLMGGNATIQMDLSKEKDYLKKSKWTVVQQPLIYQRKKILFSFFDLSFGSVLLYAFDAVFAACQRLIAFGGSDDLAVSGAQAEAEFAVFAFVDFELGI